MARPFPASRSDATAPDARSAAADPDRCAPARHRPSPPSPQTATDPPPPPNRTGGHCPNAAPAATHTPGTPPPEPARREPRPSASRPDSATDSGSAHPTASKDHSAPHYHSRTSPSDRCTTRHSDLYMWQRARSGAGPGDAYVATPPDPPAAATPRCCSRRPANPGTMPTQVGPDLLRTPARMLVANFKHRRHHRTTQRLRMMQRRTAQVRKTRSSSRQIPRTPLVRRLPAHPVTPAKLRDRYLLCLPLQYQLQPFFHDTGLFPGHRHLHANVVHLLPMSPVYSVTHVPGSDQREIISER